MQWDKMARIETATCSPDVSFSPQTAPSRLGCATDVHKLVFQCPPPSERQTVAVPFGSPSSTQGLTRIQRRLVLGKEAIVSESL